MAHRRLVVGLLLGAALAGCRWEAPFTRDNLWDPGATNVKELLGPDSTFAIGDTFSLTLRTEPALPATGYTISWFAPGAADTSTNVYTAVDGRFLVTRAHADFAVVTVGVAFGDVTVGHQVIVGQRLATLALTCGTVAAPVACDATPLAVDATRAVVSTMLDRNGNAIRRRQAVMARSTYVTRDPAVLSVQPTTPNAAGTYTVRGAGIGSTWLVVTADGRRDSVRVVVSGP